jgi:ABC-type dipeptide/oligopeptide/nickel transport system permease subunit
MIILEIILTVVAWLRGWKWKSLIPLGTVLIIGLIYGFILGLTGNFVDTTNVVWVNIFDILAIIALLIMVILPPKNKTKNDEVK